MSFISPISPISLIHRIRLRTWISLGLILVLTPLTFAAIYGVFGASGGSSANPSAVWHFDEAADNTCLGGTNDVCDDSGNGNDGAFGGSGANPSWRTEDLCISGKCLFFDGTNDTITVANTISNVRTVVFWVKPITSTEEFIALNGSANITVSGGTVTATGFSSPTIYVNGKVSSTLSANNHWQHVAVTTSTGISASAITIGNVSTNFGNIFMDEVKLFTTALTADQIRAEYAGGAGIFSDQSQFLSDGLVGYWNMDHNSGNATDRSGNGITLTNNGTTPYGIGKYGQAPTFNGSSRYFNTSTTLSNVQTVSFWVRPASTTDNFINLASGVYINSSTGTISATGFTSPTIYVNGAVSSTISASSWQMVTIVTQTPLSANAFEVGRANSSYAVNNSRIDEVRVYNRVLTPAEVKKLYEWAPGPIGYWKFDEGRGTTAQDSSGNGYNGTLNHANLRWSGGKFGSAVDVSNSGDGFTRYVNMGNILNMGANNSFTLSVWVKRVGSLSGDNACTYQIIGKFSANLGYFVGIYGDGHLSVHIETTSGNYEKFITNPFTLNEWVHVAGVFDRENANNYKLYVNGKDMDSHARVLGDLSSVGNIDNSFNFNMGQGTSCVGNTPFHFDEGSMYNYPRTQQQIIEDMNGGRPAGSSSPDGSQTAYWKFDEMKGNLAYDSGANANNLILTNSPTWRNGKINGALDFERDNSQNGYAYTTSSFFAASSLTLSAWINPESVTSDTVFAIANRGNAYRLLQYGDEIRMQIGSSSNYATTNNVNLTAGSWYHVVGVYNGPAQTVTIYVNGVEVPSTVTGTIPSSLPSDVAADFNVGGTGTATVVDNFTETYFGSATTNHNVNMPSTVNSGDLLITLFANEGDATVTAPTGWTSLASSANGTFVRLSAYYRISDGTEGSSTVNFVTSTAQQAAAQVYRITNWHGTTAPEISSAATGASSTPNPPSLTPSWGAANTLWIAVAGEFTGGCTLNPTIFPDNYWGGSWTKFNNELSSSVIASARRALNATSEDPGNFTTCSPNVWIARTIAVRPTTSTDGNFYDGIIDEVQLFPYALTPDQVKIIYNANSIANFGVGFNEKEELADGAGNPPVVWLTFDENTGSTSYDKSGNGRNGSLISAGSGNFARWNTGKIGTGVYVFSNDNDSGLDQYAHVGLPNDSLDSYSQGTISLWFKPDDTTEDDYQMLFYNGDVTGVANNAIEIGFLPLTDQIALWTNGCSSNIEGTANIPGNIRDWHHVVWTITSGANRLYIDGVLATVSYTTGSASTECFFDEVAEGETHIRLGCAAASGTTCDEFETYDGMYDDFKIYDYALSPSQVAYEYNRGKPIVWYKMDDCSGTTIYDLSTRAKQLGGGLNGTLNLGTGGVTSAGTCTTSGAWFNGATGKINYSMDFDGNDDVVSRANSSVIDLNEGLRNGFTFSGWIYPNTVGETAGRIFQKGSNGSTTDSSTTFCRVEGSSPFDIVCRVDLATSDANFTVSGIVPANQWTHVAFSWTNDADDEVTIWVNGVPYTSTASFDGDPAAESNSLYIGGNGETTNNTRAFDGQIDDFRIYTYELSQAQIRKVMNDGSSYRWGPATGSP